MHPFDILEHTFGKGEVESSILSCSTSNYTALGRSAALASDAGATRGQHREKNFALC